MTRATKCRFELLLVMQAHVKHKRDVIFFFVLRVAVNSSVRDVLLQTHADEKTQRARYYCRCAMNYDIINTLSSMLYSCPRHMLQRTHWLDYLCRRRTSFRFRAPLFTLTYLSLSYFSYQYVCRYIWLDDCGSATHVGCSTVCMTSDTNWVSCMTLFAHSMCICKRRASVVQNKNRKLSTYFITS